MWKVLRVVVWEAAILYCAQLFAYAWVGSYSSTSKFMLSMNIAELVAVMAACLTSLFR